jgi:hypothetical protein
MTEAEDLRPVPAESRSEAWQRRAAIRGEVDFTMMYVARDAFARQLSAHPGRGRGSRVHGGGEDDLGVVPQAAARAPHGGGHRTLAAPAEGRAGAGGDGDPGRDGGRACEPRPAAGPDRRRAGGRTGGRSAGGAAGAARRAGGAHAARGGCGAAPCRASPGCLRVACVHRGDGSANGGIRGAGASLSWVLDGATEEVRRSVLGMLSPPARLLYRRVWEPGYRKTERLT